MARKRKRKAQLFEIVLGNEADPIRKHFPNLKAFEYGELRILLGRNDNLGAYLLISCNSRWPEMDEIINIRNLLIASEITMGIIVPSPQFQTPDKFELHLHQLQTPPFTSVYDKEGKNIGRERNLKVAPPD